MSIENLRKHLTKSVDMFSELEKVNNQFVQPYRLLRTLSDIEHKFDYLENTLPQDEKILRSVYKFEKSGFDKLTRKDWKNLAWALGKSLPNTTEKLLFTHIGEKIISHMENIGNDLWQSIYFPLLYSYFCFEKDEISSIPTNWVQLRNLLALKQSVVAKNLNRPKKWMNTLIDYSQVLTNEPTKIFVKEFLEDNNEKRISDTLASLNIASNSWFWDDLIKTSINSIYKMEDKYYFQIIPRFLSLAEKKPIYVKEILIALLERYAISSKRAEVNGVLKNFSLDHWGNPQYSSSAAWNNVNHDTKDMVVKWFVREDLEAFFRLFSRTADVNRFNYWIKFIDKISFSQIFLGPSAMDSQQAEHKKFRDINKGRLKELMGSTSINNAFLLKIDNVYVVDFSDTGNACYAYNNLPYKDQSSRIYIGDLKNKKTVLFTNGWGEKVALTHSGDWEARFDEQLARIGIFSSSKQSNKYNSEYSRY